MTSESGEYEEDWEAAEPSVGKKSVVSTGGQVYLMENDECRDAEPTRQEEHDMVMTNNREMAEGTVKTCNEDFKRAKVDEIAVADSYVKSEDVPTSEGTQSSVEDEQVSTPEDERVNTPEDAKEPLTASSALAHEDHLLDLVRIHGQHYNSQAPPPIPINLAVTLKRLESKSQPKPDTGALQARVAAKRISEFRKRQESKAEQTRALESAWAQKRREIRRSNDAMHKALGIAGLTAQDHLRIALRRRKQEAKEKELTVSQERRNRWYNNTPKRPARGPEHIRELQLKDLHEKRNWANRIQLKQKTIRANQLELRQKAQAIVSKASGAYVRGSYLLKVPHQTMKKRHQPPPNDQKDIEVSVQ